MLERAIALRDEGRVVRALPQPTLRVTTPQGPFHHIEAFVDHAIRMHKARHRSRGRGLEKRRWLAGELNFAQRNPLPRHRQSQARAHRIRAAPE